MKPYLVTLLASVFALASSFADAQQKPQRIRGTIAAFDGNALSVKTREGDNMVIQVTERTVIVFTQPIELADIRPGDFLGVTSVKREDGVLTAYEVRRFPKPVNPGHRPFDGKDDQTMTNATVSLTVQSANGRELTLSYEGGSQKITVPVSASISTLVPGQLAQLVASAPVNLTARPADDGMLTALRIQVSPAARK